MPNFPISRFAAALLATVSLILQASAARAADQAAEELAPAGPWHVDYSRDSCNLLRDFKDAKGTILALRMEQFRPGTSVSIALIGKAVWTENRFLAADIHFLPGGGDTVTNGAMSGTMEVGGKRTSVIVGLGGSLFAAPDQTPMPVDKATFDSVRFDIKSFQRPIVLNLGPMQAPLAALQACMDDLVRHWGLDPAVQYHLTPPTPLGDVASWVLPDDFPERQLFYTESSTVHFRLMVGTNGEVTGCSIQDVVPAPGFAERSCALLTARAHFKPALDAHGQPVASYYANMIKWISFTPWESLPRLPKEAPEVTPEPKSKTD